MRMASLQLLEDLSGGHETEGERLTLDSNRIWLDERLKENKEWKERIYRKGEERIQPQWKKTVERR